MINPTYVNHACPEKFLSLFFLSDDDMASPDIVSFWWQEIQTPEGAAAFLHESAQEIQDRLAEEHTTHTFWEEKVQTFTTKLYAIAHDIARPYGLKVEEYMAQLSQTPLADEIDDPSWFTRHVRIPCVSIPYGGGCVSHVNKIDLDMSMSGIIDDTMLSLTYTQDTLLIGGYQYADVYSFRNYARDLDMAVREALACGSP